VGCVACVEYGTGSGSGGRLSEFFAPPPAPTCGWVGEWQELYWHVYDI